MKTSKFYMSVSVFLFVLLSVSSYQVRIASAADLTNVIRILQISVGLNVSPQSGDDANGDGKISMEDLVCILQIVAGLREETADEDAWKSNLGYIYLQESGITYSGTGISVSGTIATITAGGDYTVTGTLTNGMIVVNTTEKAKLRLSGVNITHSSGPAIFISNADKAFITITDGTTNSLTDGSSYSSTMDAKGTIFSNDTLEIKGKGTLYLSGNYKHAIAGDDDIIIENGTIIIEKSVKDGIHANNNVTIDGGTITITSSSDGIESEGDIVVNDGSISVSATDDGLIAATDVTINGGTVTVSKSVEGIEAKGNTIINAGTVNVIASNNGIVGVSNVTVNGGTVNVAQSVEAIESKGTIVVNAGMITVVATDDGLNAASSITINGGYLYSNTTADAIDSNGTLNINGGVIVATGGNAPEGGADCDQNIFTIKGGTLIATGGANSTPSTSTSTQCSVLLGNATTGSIVRITDSGGTEVLTFKVTKAYSNMLFTSPNLTLGKTYTVYTGGTVSGGTNFYGLYTGATYSGGTASKTFTTTSVVTNAGGTSGGGPGVRP